MQVGAFERTILHYLPVDLQSLYLYEQRARMQTWRLAMACDDEDALGGQPMHTLCHGRV